MQAIFLFPLKITITIVIFVTKKYFESIFSDSLFTTMISDNFIHKPSSFIYFFGSDL
jgi:hypothetical protein